MAIEEVDLARRGTQKINELTENSRLSETKLWILASVVLTPALQVG
jgi:hypothetical protein